MKTAVGRTKMVGGKTEYAVTFPVPAPSDPGRYALLMLTPEGRPAVVLVDRVVADPRTASASGYRGRRHVVTLARVPWVLIDRALIDFVAYDELVKRRRHAMRAELREMGLLGEDRPKASETPDVPATGYL